MKSFNSINNSYCLYLSNSAQILFSDFILSFSCSYQYNTYLECEFPDVKTHHFNFCLLYNLNLKLLELHYPCIIKLLHFELQCSFSIMPKTSQILMLNSLIISVCIIL